MKPTASTELVRIIRCGIGSETYCLEMSSVDGVAEAALVQRLPAVSDDGQVGVLPTEFGPVPVYGLAQRLDRPTVITGEREHVIVLKTSLGRWALLVESVSRVTHVRVDQILRVPEVVMDPVRNLFKGVVLFTTSTSNTANAQTASLFQIDREADHSTQNAAIDETAISLLLSPERLHPQAGPAVVPELDDVIASQSVAAASATSAAQRKGQVVILSVTDDRVDQQRCAIGLSLSQVLEVVSKLPVIPVPTAPSFVLGLACWRNQPVPLLNLAERFGLPGVTQKQRVVIARGTELQDIVAFPVDSSIRSVKLPLPAKASESPNGLRLDLVRGIFQLEAETLVVPDLHRVLTCV